MSEEQEVEVAANPAVDVIVDADADGAVIQSGNDEKAPADKDVEEDTEDVEAMKKRVKEMEEEAAKIEATIHGQANNNAAKTPSMYPDMCVYVCAMCRFNLLTIALFVLQW